MDSGIHLKYLWHDADLVEVEIRASNGEFSGTAQTYIEAGGLAKSAANLAGFPNDPTDIRELQFGEFGTKFAGGFIHLRFFCLDSAGHAAVEIRIESAHLSDLAVKGSRASQSAHFFAGVEASAVDDFVAELGRMENDRSGTASLRFDRRFL
jgi:hypothetical protein